MIKFIKRWFPYLAVAIATYLASRSLGKSRVLDQKAKELDAKQKEKRAVDKNLEAKMLRKERDEHKKNATKARTEAQKQIDSIEQEDMRDLLNRWNK